MALSVRLNCDLCGKLFWRQKSDIDHRKRIGQTTFFCGKKCSTRLTNKRKIVKRYRWVQTPDGRNTYEHRYIMEKHLGRRLKRSEHVHHKDENPLNNRLSNLKIVTAKEHALLHRQASLGFDLAHAVRLYRKNLTFIEIAKITGAYSATEIIQALKRRGLHMPGSPTAKRRTKMTRKKHWKFNLAELKRLAASAVPRPEIARKLGIGLDTVNLNCAKHDISTYSSYHNSWS